MTAYKESGIKWLGKIPAHWEVKSLKEFFIEYDERCGDRVYELLSVTQDKGIIKQSDIKIKKDISNDDKTKYKILPLGAIAYNKMRMWQGAFGLNTICDGIVSPAYVVIKKRKDISLNYFNYLFKSTYMISEFGKYSYGLCDDMNSLRYEDFKEIKFLAPPLEEQRKIADFLDKKLEKIDYFIAKQTKFIELLKEQKQVLINQTITKGLNKSIELKDTHIPYLGKTPAHWEVKKLKYVCSSSGSNLTLKEIYEEQDKKEYLVFGASGIVGSLGTYQQEKECIGIVKDGAGVGRVFLLPKYSSILATLNYLHHCDSFLNINFFYYLLNTINFMDFVQNSTIPHIYFKDYSELFIALPPLEEQKKIAKYLDEKCEKIDKAIDNIERLIKLMQEYKTSLIDTITKGMLKELK